MNMAYNLPVYNNIVLKIAAYRRLRDLGYVWRGRSRINEFDGRVTYSIQIYTEEKYIMYASVKGYTHYRDDDVTEDINFNTLMSERGREILT